MNTENKIKWVLFDLGGVLVKVHPVSFYRKLNIDEEKIKKHFHEIEGPISLGYEDPESVLKELIKMYDVDIPFDQILTSFKEDYIGDIIKELYDLIIPLKEKGYSIGLLSNTNKIHISYIQSLFNNFTDFDKLYLSYEIHLMKPHKEIFQYVLNDLGVEPGEILFIDDSKENLNSASQIGWNILQVNSNNPDSNSIKDRLFF